MAERLRLNVQTVPIGTDLADALCSWLISKYRNDKLGLADVLLLLPNNRAVSAMMAAFVRLADKGLILPRMVAIGDLALDEKLGLLLDPLVAGEEAPYPAVTETERLMQLVALVRQHRKDASAAEALHLAKQLVQTLDELAVEEKSLRESQFDHPNADLAMHWSAAYDLFLKLCTESDSRLAQQKVIAPAALRNILLDRLAERLNSNPLQTPVIAAGISTAAPAIARLLAQIARLPSGLVLLPHVDLTLPREDWDALADFGALSDAQDKGRASMQETHPQYHLKLLLHKMGVDRNEVTYFDGLSIGHRVTRLVQVVQDIFCIPDKTVEWQGLPQQRRKLEHVRLVEAEDSAEEARVIAVLAREAVESPGIRVALVTPDREIAMRVAAQLRRWNIEADDSAGSALADDPAGILFLSISKMLSTDLAPVPLLAVLKHPLVQGGDARLEWLEKVRELDLVLRGPQIKTGADAIALLVAQKVKDRRADAALASWWAERQSQFRPQLAAACLTLKKHLDAVTTLADQLSEGAIWKGRAGHRLAEFVEEISSHSLDALSDTDVAAYPELLASLLADISIRPAFGRHPRVAIYGLLEARLQSADLLICAGLNEGSWPQLPQPDPWLAPHLRRQLGLAGLDRNIGLSAHDLATALGAPEVVLTRSKRDRSGPTIASRFLLRIQALFGDKLRTDERALQLARRLDEPERHVDFHPRPAPMPDANQRMVAISITQMDMLSADPFAFYARDILKLENLKPVDADPDAAWKGTLVHKIIEDWTDTGNRDPESLVHFAENALSNAAVTPALRLLWQPRIVAGLRWIASEIASNAGQGRQIAAHEIRAEGQISGVRVHGRIDRIDRHPGGGLVIVDYKTGGPPAKGKVNAGYALQLGLAGYLVESGGVKECSGKVEGYEYWSLAKNKAGQFGFCEPPFSAKEKDQKVNAETFAGFADGKAREAINRWILGGERFTAKLKPDYAIYQDYDQLMRLDEWIGRENWIEDAHGE